MDAGTRRYARKAPVERVVGQAIRLGLVLVVTEGRSYPLLLQGLVWR
jgi:hypothetical protein